MDAAIRMARAIRRCGVLAAVAGMALVACGTVEPGQRATEYLDETSGATITRVEELQATMAQAGCATLADITPNCLTPSC